MNAIVTNTAPHATPRRGLAERLRRAGGLRRSEWIWGYLFISINLIFFLVFILGPIIQSFIMAFTSWSLLKPPQFVGLGNFRRLIDDDLFRTSLFNTVYFVAGYVPLITVLAFLLAVLLNRPLKGVGFLRAVYFLPSVVLLVSVAMVWHWLLDPQAGVINWLLKALGLPAPMWLAEIRLAMPTLITIAVWRGVGYFAVIYLAGLQTIPGSLYEAAEIDGASGYRQMIHITVPLVSPTSFFVIVTSMIAGWQEFGLPFLMTGGGPANSTLTFLLYLYREAFTSLRLGYASLMAWVLFLVIFAVTLIEWRFVKGGEHVLAQ